jgi:hypothetical protein
MSNTEIKKTISGEYMVLSSERKILTIWKFSELEFEIEIENRFDGESETVIFDMSHESLDEIYNFVKGGRQ